MKIDLHCHSKASWDCTSEFEAIRTRCIKQDITVQAITDHNEIWGAQAMLELCRTTPELTIIVGEEVYSQAGEIIGLFLQERIPSGLTALETARRIKAQGGLVLLPHPFDSLKRSHLRSYAREEIKDLVDIVEVFNGHISYQRFNTRAQAWAADNNKRMSAGSDAHTAEHVGTAYVETPDRAIQSPDDLFEVLDKAIIKGVWRHPVKTLISRLKHSQSKTQ